MVVALTLTNEMIGATGVMVRRAAYVREKVIEVDGYSDEASDRRRANERRTSESRCLGDCYTFCDTAARISLRFMRPAFRP